MYDRETRTLWNHLTGEPVLGELAAKNIRLKVLPVVVTTWSEWLVQHPETRVLDLQTGFQRPYLPGAAYGDYYSSRETMFPVWRRSSVLDTKTRVFALQIGGIPKAYPLEVLNRERVVNDTLGAQSVVVIASRGSIRIKGDSRRIGPVEYDAGGEVRAYERGNRTFRPGAAPEILLDENGQAWRVTEDALTSPANEKFSRLGGHLAYWFGWFSFYPQTLIYGVSPK